MHRRGGLPFALLAVLMLVPAIVVLQRAERHIEEGLGLRPLERFPFVAELAAGGPAVEFPVDFDAVAVHAAVPRPVLTA